MAKATCECCPLCLLKPFAACPHLAFPSGGSGWIKKKDLKPFRVDVCKGGLKNAFDEAVEALRLEGYDFWFLLSSLSMLYNV